MLNHPKFSVGVFVTPKRNSPNSILAKMHLEQDGTYRVQSVVPQAGGGFQITIKNVGNENQEFPLPFSENIFEPKTVH